MNAESARTTFVCRCCKHCSNDWMLSPFTLDERGPTLSLNLGFGEYAYGEFGDASGTSSRTERVGTAGPPAHEADKEASTSPFVASVCAAAIRRVDCIEA